MAVIGGSTILESNPRYWPIQYVPTVDTLSVTSGTGSYSPNVSTFWTVFAQQGGVNTATKNADTFYTYLDVSGTGFMGSIVLPNRAAGGGTTTYTLKLTTDGVEETMSFPSLLINQSYGAVIGHVQVRPGSNTSSNFPWLMGNGINYFNSSIDSNGNFAPETAGPAFLTVLPAFKMAEVGMPVHRFETSLKVEVSMDETPNSATYVKNGGVTYLLNPVRT
tara:strand:+ start:69 stop:728 length:660 start_codon:yes stop_codon:yes gene_type:complete